ncbi:hypothetical protein DFP72DRAFT_869369 [Ephemerocybe angulata]|uniref:NYN domain-containing protein n=1 Tax=Ephemerocybe angulata TaxID=980116 RepID=A0A8H6MH74_9AGAR|nr:hypothetical protein DFP72DRAFT_869369 [Tulosesus angulatus]
MGTTRIPSVTVLWDLETCFPSNLCASDAVEVVRKVTASHGNITKMQGFWLNEVDGDQKESSGAQPFANNPEYLQGLQKQGVIPVECSFLAGESVEKAMLIAMFVDTIDAGFHSPPTIFVISRNATLDYAANELLNRNYKVHRFNHWEHLHIASAAVPPDTAPPSLPPGVPGPSTSPSIEGIEASDLKHLHPAVRAKFRALIEVLQSDDKGRMSRADVGNKMIKHTPNVYALAGFAGKKGFKQYLDAAELHSVIQSGGGGAGAYVELNTDSCDQ